MKLISLNIEEDAHLEQVASFINSEKPDVMCLQEVQEPSLSFFKELGYPYVEYLPQVIKTNADGHDYTWGVALFSKTPLYEVRSFYYHNAKKPLNHIDFSNIDGTLKYGAIIGRVILQRKSFLLVTTHFIWTFNGLASVIQEEGLRTLLQNLPQEPHVLCGDFNMPREKNTLYATLASGYIEGVPREYHSSLDRELHKARAIPGQQHILDSYMVDHLLLKPPFSATNVRLQFGVSDHAAIVAIIE